MINKNPRTGSFFRDWDIRNDLRTKLRKTKHVNEETVFYAFMHILCWFGKDPKESTEETKKIFNNSKLKDAALFEFAVYLYLNIDIWFFHNNKSKRNVIADYLQKRFLELALIALPTHEVTQIFNNRLNFYGSLIRLGKGNDIFKHYLPELIGFTLKDNTLKEDYDPEGAPLLLGAMDSFNIKIQLGETYTHGMDYIEKILKNCK